MLIEVQDISSFCLISDECTQCVCQSGITRIGTWKLRPSEWQLGCWVSKSSVPLAFHLSRACLPACPSPFRSKPDLQDQQLNNSGIIMLDKHNCNASTFPPPRFYTDTAQQAFLYYYILRENHIQQENMFIITIHEWALSNTMFSFFRCKYLKAWQAAHDLCHFC